MSKCSGIGSTTNLVRLVLDESGVVHDQIVYDAFGNIVVQLNLLLANMISAIATTPPPSAAGSCLIPCGMTQGTSTSTAPSSTPRSL
ncbi:MAG: hypothetical protein RMJ88_16355 [Thermogemmata sp.]|nr:hypothetical protein [Thermogemmata sp.]